MWSWLLTAVGVVGFVLAGRKVWWCWYVNLGCQALWLTYALTTHQYGFIAGALIYTVVFSRNAISWTHEHRRPLDPTDPTDVRLPVEARVATPPGPYDD